MPSTSSWGRLDGGFWSHAKIRKVGNAAAGAFSRLISYSAQQQTDGFVDTDIVEYITTGRAELKKLVDSGLLVPVDGGYLLHDYHDYNPSREKLAEDRKATADRVAKWRSNNPGNALRNGAGNADVAPDVTAVTNAAPLHSTPPVLRTGQKTRASEPAREAAAEVVAFHDLSRQVAIPTHIPEQARKPRPKKVATGDQRVAEAIGWSNYFHEKDGTR